MSRILLIPLAALLALGLGRSAPAEGPADEPAEVLAVFTTTNAFAPLITELAIRNDGSVLQGSIGQATPCPHRLPPARLETLRASLRANHELFGTASFSYRPWADADGITFQLPSPPLPDATREVEIPMELFPVRLVPLLELLDSLGSQACGTRHAPISPLVR